MNIKSAITHIFPKSTALVRQMRDQIRLRSFKKYETAYGFTLRGDLALDASRSESNEIRTFLDELATCDEVIDVGANVGLFTLLAAKAHKRCYAFEPHPLNVQLLCRNIYENTVRGVDVYPVALSSENKVVLLLGGGQGASLEKGWGGIETNYTTFVPGFSLDSLLGKQLSGKKLLIKIDVEGHEFNVLKGAQSFLTANLPPVWILEHGLTENFGASVNPHYCDVFSMFRDAGYRCYSIEDQGAEVTVEDAFRWMAKRSRDFGGINFLFKYGPKS